MSCPSLPHSPFRVRTYRQLQKHLGVKLAHLDLGANSVQCLDAMRVRAYQLKMEERAEEDNKPLW